MQALTADLIRSQGQPLNSPGCWEEYLLNGRRWFVKGENILKAVPLGATELPKDPTPREDLPS